ncbi:MAG: hypothetical protein WCI54_01660 [Bacteroidia bacterium]|jgi:hypothetical protein
MRYNLFLVCLFFILNGYSQNTGRILISGIVLSSDSVPVQGAAIINVQTGKLIHTDKKGFFQSEFAVKDSLLIYHIAYKKMFVNKNDNRKYFVLEPEIHELLQVDVLDKSKQEKKYLDSTMIQINQLAPKEKLTGYDKKSTMTYFIEENGSHTRGFSPYFGPTFKFNFGRNTNNVIRREQKRQLKEMTSHYHLVKTEKGKSQQ